MNRTILGFSISILILFGFFSCDKENARPEVSEYFPLHIGDKWTYQVGSSLIVNRIDKTEVIDGLLYFHMIQEVEEDVSEIGYYRKTTDGKVYFRLKEFPEELRFDLNAKKGESWTTDTGQENSLEWHIQLVDDAKTFQIGPYTISNCLLFDFDVPRFIDEEHGIILAPGIGIVSSISYAWGGESRLYKAVINGDEIEF